MADAQDAGVTKEQVQSFFRNLEFRFQTASECNLYSAAEFNVFHYMRPEPKLSWVICDLLDPRGAHGQRDRFLSHFLTVISHNELNVTPGAIARCEEPTRRARNRERRIDIVVSPDGDFGIGIENKPWAPDQTGWVVDYSDHLSAEYRGKFLLVLLTRQGRVPEAEVDKQRKEELERGKKFLTITYASEFKDWLQLCLRDCRAERVERFLRDFINYLPAIEGGNMASEQEKTLVADYMVQYPKSLKVGRAVYETWPETVGAIATKFQEELEQKLRAKLPEEWKITRPDNTEILKGNDHGQFRLFKRGWLAADAVPRYAIVLTSNETNCGKIGIGVWKNGQSVPHIEGLYETLRNANNLGEMCLPWWEWWTYVKENYRSWSAPDTMERLLTETQRESALNYLADWFVSIKEKTERTIDDALPATG